MKIAIIGTKGIPAIIGGVERHIEEISARLVKSGECVFVYARTWYLKTKKHPHQGGKGAQKLKIWNGVNIIQLPSIRTKHLDAITHTFLATMHALFCDYDIIHYHGVGPALLAWMPRLFKPSARVVVTFHCIDRKHQKWGLFARLMLRLGEWCAIKFADKTIVVSKTLYQYCCEAYDAETEYIPNGVDSRQQIADNRLQEQAIKKFGLEKDKYILMVSRLVKHKGIHYLIEAFKNVKCQMSNVKLVIAGSGAFTDNYVKELQERAGDNQNIVFTGTQTGEALTSLYSNAYMVVHPSESEGLSISVLEAMSYGKAVLASDIPENLEVVKEHGFSFKNKDAADLEQKMTWLLKRPELVKDTGQKAKGFVIAHYNWDNIIKETQQLYYELMPGDAKEALSVI